MVKRGVLICLLFMMIFTTGCWDMINIEENDFISGVAVDEPDPEVVAEQRARLKEPELFTPRYSVTYLSPIPSALTKKGGEQVYDTKSITGPSPNEVEREMVTRAPKRIDFSHTELVLIGEKIFKDPEKIKESMDYLQRNQRFNWNILVGVVDGRAGDAFNIENPVIKNPASYLTDIMRNRRLSSRVADVTLTQMTVDMGEDGTMALPKVILAKDELKVEGAAVIKDFTLAGYISGTQSRDVMFLKGTIEGGNIFINYGDFSLPYIIKDAKVKKDLKVTDEGLQLTYRIQSEGELEQGIYGENFFDDKAVRKIESRVEKELAKDCMNTIRLLQNKYHADIIYAGDYIRKYHPKIWKQIEGDWETVFSEMDFRVETDIHIRRAGVVK